MRELKINQIYHHFKGNDYIVLHEGVDADDMTPVVIYKPLNKDLIFVRRKEEFLSLVDKAKYPNVTQKYRFEEVD